MPGGGGGANAGGFNPGFGGGPPGGSRQIYVANVRSSNPSLPLPHVVC